MNSEFEKEITYLKEKIDDLENKYYVSTNYDLFCAIFDKLGVEELTFNKDEIKNKTDRFILENNIEKNEITISRCKDE